MRTVSKCRKCRCTPSKIVISEAVICSCGEKGTYRPTADKAIRSWNDKQKAKRRKPL